MCEEGKGLVEPADLGPVRSSFPKSLPGTHNAICENAGPRFSFVSSARSLFRSFVGSHISAFNVAAAGVHAWDQPGVASKMRRRRKPFDSADLERQHHAQNPAHIGRGLEQIRLRI